MLNCCPALQALTYNMTGSDIQVLQDIQHTRVQQHNGSDVAQANLWSLLAGGGDAFSKRGLAAPGTVL